MKPRVIGMLITLRCNAACKHCCFSSNPNRIDVMPLEEALMYVDQIADTKALRGISITGGEPFVEYATLSAIVKHAGLYGLKSRIVSNCFWASTREKAYRKLETLVDNGLSELSVSFDATHEEYVKKKNVKNAVEVALELGLKVVISTVIPNGDIAKHAQKVQTDLALPQHESLFIMPGYIVPSGESIKHFSLESLSLVDGSTENGKRLHHSCPHVIREPIITPSGDLAACCSPSSATHKGFDESYVIGNLHDTHISDLLSKLENSLIFNAIMMDGPWKLFQIVERVDPNVMKRKKFINICDLCYQLMSNASALKIIQDELSTRSAELFLSKAYIQAMADGDVDDYISKKVGLYQLRPHK